ncbi:MAG: hypothetical protein RL063_1181 [Pseudomonadota bacterium]|jgi:hypothetical protein
MRALTGTLLAKIGWIFEVKKEGVARKKLKLTLKTGRPKASSYECY